MFIPDRKVGPNLEKLVSRTDESTLDMRTAVDSGDSNITYMGEARVGAGTDEEVWRIKKMYEGTGLIITWAGGGEFNQVWDDRESLVYSQEL